MTKNEKLCILCNALYTLTSGMSAVFMNVFLYTYTGSLIVMAIYTCIHIALMPICFTIAGKMALKIHYGITLSIGLFFLVIQLLFVLYCNELFGIYHYYVYIVAIFFGIGEGFYYLSLNTLHQLVTTPQSRNLFIGVGGVLNNIASVVAPLLATFVIDASIDDINKCEKANFDLPTEAQWEFAAKGGVKSKGYIYSGSNNLQDVAQGDVVKSKLPNELGIYDMSGGNYEAVKDYYDVYPSTNQIDPCVGKPNENGYYICIGRGGSLVNYKRTKFSGGYFYGNARLALNWND